MRMMFAKFNFRQDARILLVLLLPHDIISTSASIFHLNYQVPRKFSLNTFLQRSQIRLFIFLKYLLILIAPLEFYSNTCYSL